MKCPKCKSTEIYYVEIHKFYRRVVGETPNSLMIEPDGSMDGDVFMFECGDCEHQFESKILRSYPDKNGLMMFHKCK